MQQGLSEAALKCRTTEISDNSSLPTGPPIRPDRQRHLTKKAPDRGHPLGKGSLPPP